MSVRVQTYSIRGSAHPQCEDVLVTHEYPDHSLFAGIADGQSGMSRCEEGARLALSVTQEYLAGKRIGEILPECARYDLLREIHSAVTACSARFREDIHAFSSTLCCIYCRPEEDAFLTMHIGDGAIIGIPREAEPYLISFAEYGMTRQHTWMTTSAGAAEHLRFAKGHLSQFQSVYLLSDGAECLSDGHHILPQSEGLLKDGNFMALSAFVTAQAPCDDAGIIRLSARQA